jgi:hypothetical protein
LMNGGTPCEAVVIFLHNLKTGGQTLRRIIPRQYKQNAVYNRVGKPESLSEIQDIRQLNFERIRCVQGHLVFGVHELIPCPSTYVTLVRNPLDRIVSLYHYILAKPGRGLHRQSASQLGSFEQFLTSGVLLEADNGQTRRISGLYPEFGQCTVEMLETAKQNLRDHFAVVGLTERFDESLMLMKSKFGWRSVFYKKRNVTRDKPAKDALPVETLRTIEKYNRLDVELYEYARGLLDEAISQQGSDFAADVQLFKRINADLAGRKALAREDGSYAGRMGVGGQAAAVLSAPAPAMLLDAHARLMVRENELHKENTGLRLQGAELEKQIAGLREELRFSPHPSGLRPRGLRRLRAWHRQARAWFRSKLREPSQRP